MARRLSTMGAEPVNGAPLQLVQPEPNLGQLLDTIEEAFNLYSEAVETGTPSRMLYGNALLGAVQQARALSDAESNMRWFGTLCMVCGAIARNDTTCGTCRSNDSTVPLYVETPPVGHGL